MSPRRPRGLQRGQSRGRAARRGTYQGRAWHLGGRANGVEQALRIVAAVVPDAVDEERRCPVDPAADPAHEVLADPWLIGVLLELEREPLEVETEHRCVA